MKNISIISRQLFQDITCKAGRSERSSLDSRFGRAIGVLLEFMAYYFGSLRKSYSSCSIVSLLAYKLVSALGLSVRLLGL